MVNMEASASSRSTASASEIKNATVMLGLKTWSTMRHNSKKSFPNVKLID